MTSALAARVLGVKVVLVYYQSTDNHIRLEPHVAEVSERLLNSHG